MYKMIWHCLGGVSCTIRSGIVSKAFHVRYDLALSQRHFMYDINLGATHTMMPSTRGVMIPIYLVSNTMDSIRRSVVLFKTVTKLTSDPKSEFLCQLSLSCAEPTDPLNHLVHLGYLPRPCHHISSILSES